ncbi:hypothetical protein ACLOJK_010988 [Asimina triloba]
MFMIANMILMTRTDAFSKGGEFEANRDLCGGRHGGVYAEALSEVRHHEKNFSLVKNHFKLLSLKKSVTIKRDLLSFLRRRRHARLLKIPLPSGRNATVPNITMWFDYLSK